ncbi:MAG: hypothetical protein EBZ59_10370, partial [Planctomycetia bacterium]|nr:hypothetical protein [Planctomycetia bacterium]
MNTGKPSSPLCGRSAAVRLCPRLAVWAILGTLSFGGPSLAPAAEIHVAPSGDDAHSGAASSPLATLAAAQRAARALVPHGPVTVTLQSGTYRLPEPLVLTAADSGTEYRAAPGAKVVVSGAVPLDLRWTASRDGIRQARTGPGVAIDQLLVNGRLQRMARYPNYDPDAMRPSRFGPGANGAPDAPKFNGCSADATAPERVARWSDPAGGYLHALQAALWGSLHYRILGRRADG